MDKRKFNHMKMTRADILQDTNFAPVVSSVVRADDDEVVTRVKGYIGKLFVFFHVLFHSFYLCKPQIQNGVHVYNLVVVYNVVEVNSNHLPSDAGTCDSVSSSTTCGDDASSYYTSFTYNGKRVIISNQVDMIDSSGWSKLSEKCSTRPSIGA